LCPGALKIELYRAYHVLGDLKSNLMSTYIEKSNFSAVCKWNPNSATDRGLIWNIIVRLTGLSVTPIHTKLRCLKAVKCIFGVISIHRN
jgi:hypothetical protein